MVAMRSAILCSGVEEYGVAAVLELYAKEIDGLTFVCLAKGPLYERLTSLGARVEYLPAYGFTSAHPSSLRTMVTLARHIINGRRLAPRLLELLRRHDIRLLHINWMPHYFTAMYLRKRGIRTVWQIHNNMNPARLFGMGPLLYFRLARRGADLLLPVSDFIAGQWEGSRVPLRVVRTAAPPTLMNDALSLASSPLRCVAAGRLTPGKGIHVAIAAVAEARKRGVEVTLDVYGGPLQDNQYADDLAKQIGELDLAEVVVLRGPVHDVRTIHQHFQVALHCRVDPEPCSVWICEAMLDGLLVLATSTGGTPELISHGETGLLYAAGDVDQLAELIALVCADRDTAERIRLAGRQKAARRFTPKRMSDETLQAYASALSDS